MLAPAKSIPTYKEISPKCLLASMPMLMPHAPKRHRALSRASLYMRVGASKRPPEVSLITIDDFFDRGRCDRPLCRRMLAGLRFGSHSPACTRGSPVSTSRVVEGCVPRSPLPHRSMLYLLSRAASPDALQLRSSP
jgi:hypothetical protein